jgi:hypothetical protein
MRDLPLTTALPFTDPCGPGGQTRWRGSKRLFRRSILILNGYSFQWNKTPCDHKVLGYRLSKIKTVYKRQRMGRVLRDISHLTKKSFRLFFNLLTDKEIIICNGQLANRDDVFRHKVFGPRPAPRSEKPKRAYLRVREEDEDFPPPMIPRTVSGNPLESADRFMYYINHEARPYERDELLSLYAKYSDDFAPGVLFRLLQTPGSALRNAVKRIISVPID